MAKGDMDRIGGGLVCALLLLIQYGSGAELNITSENPSPSVLTGDTINLAISYNSTPSLIIWTAKGNVVAVWRNGEQSIDDNYRNRLTIQENEFSLNSSTPADSGDYMVIVNDASGDSGNRTFSVVVTDSVPKIQSNDSGVFRTGQNISLTIWYDGNPFGIVWDYNGSPLIVKLFGYVNIANRFKGRTVITEDGSLLIYNTTNADVGTYTITVSSTAISASRSFQVKFYDVITNVTMQQTPTIVDETTPGVNLSCKASSGSGAVTWKKDGQPLTNDSSHVLLDQALQILNPDRTFSGIYSCNISNPVSWDAESIRMIVYYPMEEVIVTQSVEIVSEKTSLVNLSCNATSSYVEAVTWMKDSQSISNGSHYKLLDADQILQIIQPNRTFTGNYSCNVSNAVYWGIGSLQLRVYDPVENVIMAQSPEILDENSTAVNLSCSAPSVYIESVTWKKDGKSIDNNDTFSLLNGNHTLQIIDPNRTFVGEYICNISNAAYWKIGSLQLRVHDPVGKVTVAQSPKIANESSPALALTCSASSGYVESVTWTIGGNPIHISGNYNLSDDNRILQITKPSRTFNGLYTCNMSNAVYWSSGSLQLLVYDEVLNVKVTQTPDKVNNKSPFVKLDCSASSGYSEAVTWTQDGQSVINKDSYSLLNGNTTLQITQPNKKSNGIYTCTIANAVYSGSGFLNLTIPDATPPRATSTFGILLITLLGGILLSH